MRNFLFEEKSIDIISKLLSKLNVSHGINDVPLYRGMDVTTQPVAHHYKVDGEDIAGGLYVVNVRKNRVPKDTNPALSKILDEVLYEKTGYYLRSQAVFVGFQRSVAFPYGRVHRVFPIGDFKLFQTNSRDLYLTSNVLFSFAIAIMLIDRNPDKQLHRQVDLNTAVKELFADIDVSLDMTYLVFEFCSRVLVFDHLSKKDILNISNMKDIKKYGDIYDYSIIDAMINNNGVSKEILSIFRTLINNMLVVTSNPTEFDKNSEIMMVCDQYVACKDQLFKNA